MNMKSDEKPMINPTMSIKVQFLIYSIMQWSPWYTQLGYYLMLLMERIEHTRHTTLM